jgi:RNA repair, ligase-Pnkp-associating, region of Hen1
MLLTLTTTHNPATDLGYLLHKNPAKLHSFELSFGKAHVFYPEATSEKCTAALLPDVDPVALVRGKRGQHEGGTLDQYVNDRPYVLSSFLSVAMGRAFGTAMSGRSKGRQELADLPIPLTATLTVVACRSGERRTASCKKCSTKRWRFDSFPASGARQHTHSVDIDHAIGAHAVEKKAVCSGRLERKRDTLFPLLEHAIAYLHEFRVRFNVGVQFL